MAYILVVDDDPNIRDLARDTLRDAGHCPVLVPDVFRALDVLNHQEPDLVLTACLPCDLSACNAQADAQHRQALEFPDLDGYDLTRAIRKYHPDLPVIALVNGSQSSTGHPSTTYFDAVIRKPFEVAEFSDTVNAILDES